MRTLRRAAAGIVLGTLAALCIISGSQAASKSWGEECKAEPHTPIGPPHDDPKKMCCVDKWHQCSKNCDRTFGDGDAISLCRQACSREHDKCLRDVEHALRPGFSKPVQSQTGKTHESRVCCRTGSRHGWATRQDCRRRAGQAVHGRFCANPAVRRNPAAGNLKSTPARICCRKGRSHQWASPSGCRAGRGRPVNEKYCRRPVRPRARASGALRVCCKIRSGGRDFCSKADAGWCMQVDGIVTVDSCCEKRRVLTPRRRAQ